MSCRCGWVTIADAAKLAFQISLFAVILGYGLTARFSDVTYVLRLSDLLARFLLARFLLAVLVVAPVMAAVLVSSTGSAWSWCWPFSPSP
jgi:BASS family bile acid:Na+ symporter